MYSFLVEQQIVAMLIATKTKQKVQTFLLILI